MLARAASKMALNNMVIRRGAFVDPAAAKDTALGGDGLMDLLKPAAEETAKGAPQSRAVTDKVRPRAMRSAQTSDGVRSDVIAMLSWNEISAVNDTAASFARSRIRGSHLLHEYVRVPRACHWFPS